MKRSQSEFEKQMTEALANPKVQAIVDKKMAGARKLLANGALNNILDKKP